MLDGITIDLDKPELNSAERILHGLAYLIALSEKEKAAPPLTDARHDVLSVAVHFKLSEEDTEVMHRIGWYQPSEQDYGLSTWEVFV